MAQRNIYEHRRKKVNQQGQTAHRSEAIDHLGKRKNRRTDIRQTNKYTENGESFTITQFVNIR